MLNSVLIEGDVGTIYPEEDGDSVLIEITHWSDTDAYNQFDVILEAEGGMARKVLEKVRRGMHVRAVGRMFNDGFPRVKLQHLETGGTDDVPVRGSA